MIVSEDTVDVVVSAADVDVGRNNLQQHGQQSRRLGGGANLQWVLPHSWPHSCRRLPGTETWLAA
jgi:hypothetical protein